MKPKIFNPQMSDLHSFNGAHKLHEIARQMSGAVYKKIDDFIEAALLKILPAQVVKLAATNPGPFTFKLWEELGISFNRDISPARAQQLEMYKVLKLTKSRSTGSSYTLVLANLTMSLVGQGNPPQHSALWVPPTTNLGPSKIVPQNFGLEFKISMIRDIEYYRTDISNPAIQKWLRILADKKINEAITLLAAPIPETNPSLPVNPPDFKIDEPDDKKEES